LSTCTAHFGLRAGANAGSDAGADAGADADALGATVAVAKIAGAGEQANATLKSTLKSNAAKGLIEQRASVVAQAASLHERSHAIDMKAGWQPALRKPTGAVPALHGAGWQLAPRCFASFRITPSK